MTARKTIVGLCMLCALVFSAFAAQGASAATKGTTAFTCVSGAGTLRGQHCLTTGTASATFGHVAIAENTTTELELSNEKTETETTAARPMFLKGAIGGISLTITAKKVSKGPESVNWVENKKVASGANAGEHYLHIEFRLHFTEVTANHGCKIFDDTGGVKGAEGTITTSQLTATTEGQGDFLKFQPAVGTTFATYIVSGCEAGFSSLEKTYEMTGSLKGVPTGATVVFTHAETTAQNTLKLSGIPSGIEGALTLSGRAKGSIGAYTPLSETTVETP
jgi:hypothetical protein